MGVGKINATYNLTKLIHKYKPVEVINYGTAGSTKKGLSGIVECTKFYQRDMDVRGLLDIKLGETPLGPLSTSESWRTEASNSEPPRAYSGKNSELKIRVKTQLFKNKLHL